MRDISVCNLVFFCISSLTGKFAKKSKDGLSLGLAAWLYDFCDCCCSLVVVSSSVGVRGWSSEIRGLFGWELCKDWVSWVVKGLFWEEDFC